MDIDIILEPDLDPEQINELGIKAEEYGILSLIHISEPTRPY